MYRRSFKDYFSRNRKALYMVLGILLVSTFSLTIVYAALSVTLNITGNAEVVASSWDIHLDNVKVKSGSVSGNAPSITSPTTATFSTSLITPGDFYEFTVDVVNSGSIDAMIDSVVKTPTLTTAQAKYLKYEIEYQSGESINTKQLVSKDSFVRLKIRVEFRNDISPSDLPTSPETLNLAFTVNYVQSDGSGSSVTDNGVTLEMVTIVLQTERAASDESLEYAFATIEGITYSNLSNETTLKIPLGTVIHFKLETDGDDAAQVIINDELGKYGSTSGFEYDYTVIGNTTIKLQCHEWERHFPTGTFFTYLGNAFIWEN